MDIYILRDGQEAGPFSIKTMQTLLEQGDVAGSDLAWHSGIPKWVPLSELLAAPAAAEPAAGKPAGPPPEHAEPASAKQKAFLSYLGIAIPAELTHDQAARLVNSAIEAPANSARFARWNEERLRLHPDIFAAEIQAKRENRANHFFDLCQTAGANYFDGITAAHCQVLVGFLDVKFPNWDAREAEAAEHYFFPAVADKFPQLVQKQWRGRLQYVNGQKVSAEITRKSSTSKLAPPSSSPIAAILRGVFLGAVILGVLYFAFYRHRDGAKSVTEPEKVAQPAPPPAVAEAAKRSAPVALATTTAPQAPVPRTPEPTPSVAPVEVALPPAPVSPTLLIPENATSAVNTATTVAMPVAPMTPTDPSMNPGTPPANPVAASVPPETPASPMAVLPSAISTAPMASLPGTEPAAPHLPPTAVTPTPAPVPDLPPEAAALPPLSPAEMLAGAPPAAPARTTLLLTKPVAVDLAYGKLTLPAGTAVKLVARQGAQLRVSYQNSVITIPAASTDLE